MHSECQMIHKIIQHLSEGSPSLKQNIQGLFAHVDWCRRLGLECVKARQLWSIWSHVEEAARKLRLFSYEQMKSKGPRSKSLHTVKRITVRKAWAGRRWQVWPLRERCTVFNSKRNHVRGWTREWVMWVWGVNKCRAVLVIYWGCLLSLRGCSC